jgi:hypothetical protein
MTDRTADRPDTTSLPGRVAAVVARVGTDRLAAAYFLALALAAFLPTLGGGFLLQLDMVFAPNPSYLRFALASKGPLYYGRLPLVALLDVVTLAAPDWALQRTLLVGAVAGAGVAAYAATDGQRTEGRLFAGTLYAVNPFVYTRLLAGQWYVVLGYAVLPLAVRAFHDYVTGERPQLYRALGWATLVAVFDPHIVVLLALAGAVVLGFDARAHGPAALARAGRVGVFTLGVNAYWLLPAGFSLLAGDSQLSTVTAADLAVFSPEGAVAGNVPLSVSMLYGFWRGGYTFPFHLVPLWAVVAGFAGLLSLAVYGWLGSDDAFAGALALTSLVGGFLALGVATAVSAPVFRAVAATPVGAGMREAGKFVALLALGYALLGARGVTRLRADLDATLASWHPDRERLARVVTLGLVVAVVVSPLAYTFPMVLGFWGGFEPTDYPADWHTAADRFEHDDDRYRVLYLPWHQYLRYDWAGGKVATPASLFFGSRTVNSRDPDIGIGSQATDPTHRQLRTVLTAEPPARLGERLAALGIKYVVVSKTADYRRYDYLRADADFHVLSEGEHLVVFENRAFASAPPPATWPAASPQVPVAALLIGGLVSLATLAGLGWRHRCINDNERA